MKIKIFILLLTILHSFTKDIKRILLLIFPGGKSHHFILKELLAYSQSKVDNYEFHIICHNYDRNIWEGTNHYVYDYGNADQYTKVFEKALETVKSSPIFGYVDFHRAMIDNYQAFIDANILKKLSDIKFEIIITDFPNYMSYILKKELKIKNSLFFTPTCTPSIFYQDLEMNTAYVPIIGSEFSDDMNFLERTENFIYHYGSRIFFKYFIYLQREFWRKHNIFVSADIFMHESVYLSQCTNGVHFPMPLPPNFDNIGAILPRPSKPIESEPLVSFLKKYKRYIYFSQGTIVKIIEFEQILEIFNMFNDIGFILSFKKEFLDNHKFTENVLAMTWVPQNDLLGNDKVVGFITHGGLNSILETIYHGKPCICIGTSIDQINNAVIVEYRKIGIKITNEKDINVNFLKDAIKQLLDNEDFKKNVQKLSVIMKEQKPKEKFFYWLNYTMTFGYENLIIGSYINKSFITLNNIDVVLFLLLLVIIFLYFLKFLFGLLFKRKINTDEIKTKQN